MVALSELYTFERRKYVSPFRSAALEEESDPRINDVVLSPNNDWLNETDKKSGSKLKTVSIRFFLSKLVTTSSYTLIRMISSKIYLV